MNHAPDYVSSTNHDQDVKSIPFLKAEQAVELSSGLPPCTQDPRVSSLASKYSQTYNALFLLLHLILCVFYIYGQTSQYALTFLQVSNTETGSVIEKHTIHKFTLWGNIKMYWDDGIYVLALLCGFTSMPLPHVKILLNLYLWYTPISSKKRRIYLSLQEQSHRWLLASNVVSGYTSSSFYVKKQLKSLKVEVISLPCTGFWLLVAGSVLMLVFSHFFLVIHDRLEAKLNPRHLYGSREINWTWAAVIVVGVVSFTGSLFFINYPIVNSRLHDFLDVDDLYEISLQNFGAYGVRGNDNLTQTQFLETLDFWLYVLSPILSSLYGFVYAYQILSKGAGRMSNRILEILSASSSFDVFWLGIVLSAFYAIVLSDTLMDSVDFCHRLDVADDIKCFTVSGNVYASAWVFFPFVVLQRLFLTYLISVF